MKKTLLLLSLIAGLASANAATYNISTPTNSLYLGFFSADSVATTSVLINLGTSADVFNGFTMDLSGASSALSTTFNKNGTNWFDSEEVYWGLIGYNAVGASVQSFYVARPEGANLLINSADSTTLSSANRSTLHGRVGALITAHTAGDASYDTVVGSTGNTHEISMVGNGANAFDVQANSRYGVFQGSVFNQVIGSGLTIQQFTRSGSTFPTAFEGTFGGITQANGVITVVPEPSTYVLLGLGALMLAMVYRRRA
jgi:hypothetical protein